MVHINGPLATVTHEFAMHRYSTPLMPRPCASLRARILVPIRTTQQVNKTNANHVDGADAFRVVRANPVRKKGGLRHAVWAAAWLRLADFTLSVRDDANQRHDCGKRTD